MFNIFWNVYVFLVIYMSLDNFNLIKVNLEEFFFREEDRWIFSRVNSFIGEVIDGIEIFRLIRVIRGIYNFVVEDLSRWYIRFIRKRMWVEGDDLDKLVVYYIVWKVFDVFLRFMVLFMLYIVEEIY